MPNRPLRQRLEALAAFRPVFERPGFRFAVRGPSSVEDGVITLDGSALTPDAQRFYEMAYEYGWVRPLDWSAWWGTADGQRLINDPAVMATATADDLAWVLTTCIRADRFCDGYLENAFDAGLITRVATRAEALLAGGSLP